MVSNLALNFHHAVALKEKQIMNVEYKIKNAHYQQELNLIVLILNVHCIIQKTAQLIVILKMNNAKQFQIVKERLSLIAIYYQKNIAHM